jgi:hypothetical protein
MDEKIFATGLAVIIMSIGVALLFIRYRSKLPLLILPLLVPLPAQAGTILLAEFEWRQPEPITLPADYGFVVENIQHQPPAVWFAVVDQWPFNETASPALVERFNAITTNNPSNHRELRMHNDFQPINEFNRVPFDQIWGPVNEGGWRAEAFVPLVAPQPLYSGLWGYIVTGLDRTITTEGQLVRVYGHPIPEPAAWLLVLFGCFIQWRVR